MALTFFWRCEGTTLDGTHDYSAGDTTATASSVNVSLSATAARYGSTGILRSGNDAYYSFDSSGLISFDEGAVGVWVRLNGSWSVGEEFVRYDVSGEGYVSLMTWTNQGDFRARYNVAGYGDAVAVASHAGMGAGDWVFVVMRWDRATNNHIRVEIYDDTLTLISANNSSAPPPFYPDDLAGSVIVGSYGTDIHLDNIFIADRYDEPLQDFADITSYTEYGVSASGPSKSLGLLLRGCG